MARPVGNGNEPEERTGPLEDLWRFVRRRSEVERTRFDGTEDPLSIDRLGDLVLFRYATGPVADGATESVYLTVNGKVGGELAFSKIPVVTVWRDDAATGGGLAVADGPETASLDLTLVAHTNAKLLWVGVDKVFRVDVVNDSGAVTGFQVTAHGVA